VFLLDTNIASYWMQGDQKIINQIKDYRPCDLSISTITLAEILYGIEKSDIKKRNAAKNYLAFAHSWNCIHLMSPLPQSMVWFAPVWKKGGFPSAKATCRLQPLPWRMTWYWSHTTQKNFQGPGFER